MRANPEIQRNIWLQFSSQRLLMMPLAVGLIFFIVFQMAGDDPYKSLVGAAEGLFLLIVKIWGGYCAANSVIEEVNDRTWDFQRLSALSPWQMTVGKLFGSTLYTWYGAIIPLGVLMYALPHTQYQGNPVWILTDCILSGLSVQAMALFTSLLLTRLDGVRQKKLRPLLYLAFGLVFSKGIASQLLLTQGLLGHSIPSVVWFGHEYDYIPFNVTVAALMLAWMVAGIYWQMRGQLKMKTGPWLWVTYVLFWGIHSLGFHVYEPPQSILHFSLAPLMRPDIRGFFSVMTNLYLVTFLEQWSGVRYRRLREAWTRQDYARCIEICPRWIPTLLVCLGFATIPALIEGEAVTPLLVFLPFAVRDIALLHFVMLSPDSRRPISMTLFYLFMLYVMVPLVLVACKQTGALVGFLPILGISDTPIFADQGPTVIFLSGTLQALIMLALVFYRWKSYWLALPDQSKSEIGNAV